MQDLKVALVQADIKWESPTANLEMYAELLAETSADLIVLPELFTTGFSMNPKNLAEPMDGPSMKWMMDLAKKKNAVVTGSVIIKEGKYFFNRLLWVTPFGNYRTYDKRHLFGLAGEDKAYKEGTSRQLVVWKGWSFLPLICYDLRFPAWSRNRLSDREPEYD